MSTAVSSHSGAGPLSLMSCVRESSPPQEVGNDYEPEKNVSTKKKFWNPRKWFKRKSNKVVEEVPNNVSDSNPTLRSRSTSELSVAEEQTRRRSGTPMHPALSVSHDSVFHSPHSGSELELEAAHSTSSLSIGHQPTQPDIRLQTELIERLRQRRGDTSEDDEGLPRSPCNSPTTTEGHLEKSHNKDLPTKSHSTCSDGSLLSMGSSEMDEDSYDPYVHSRHASKLSLQERTKDVPDADVTEWGPTNVSVPLNHSAAHHKVSIRPKRTHGAPLRKRSATVVLPTTPEVNEDASGRSVTPELCSKAEALTELYSSMSYHLAQHDHATIDSKLKCSSLPPGLAGPGGIESTKLTRSRSNAGSHAQDTFAEEDEYGEGKNKDTSFFGRIFPRRSGKKKKLMERKEEVKEVSSTATTTTSSATFVYNTKVMESMLGVIAIDNNLAIRPNALRTGPASRQRVQPINIPETALSSSPKDLDDWFHVSSNASNTIESSPPKSPLMFSMSPPKSQWNEKRAVLSKNVKSSKFIEHFAASATTESKSIVRIAGLSPLQQRVISLNDDTDTGFKSLTNFPCEEKLAKPVAKAHSFKTTKTSVLSDLKVTSTYKSMEENNFIKSISLDSVKNVNNVKNIEHTSPAKQNVEKLHKAIVNIINNDEKAITNVQVNQDDAKLEFGKAKSRFSAEDREVKEAFKTVHDFEQNVMSVRKFSNDSIELVKRDESEEKEAKKKDVAIVTVTTMTNAGHYRKMSESKPSMRKKSNSFDSAESKDSTPLSSESSLDKLETKSAENIKASADYVVRRRSLVKQKDEEPELMKVFARRSLKLKDSEIEALQQQVAKMSEDTTANNNSNRSRDSDKENVSDSSPVEERRKPIIAPKGPLLETKVKIDGMDVTLRKPISKMLAAFQNRSVSIAPSVKNENKILKANIVLPTRPKTSTIINTAEIISNISEKSELNDDANVEIQNFRLRKAEWEKRAQESIKKVGP